MFWLHRLNPANKFKEYFELAQALSPESKDEVYRLRHRVYCDELGFERPSHDGRERDEFDDQSRHLLLRSVKTGVSIGCIRLVMVSPERPQLPLPFEKLFATVAGGRELDSAALPRRAIAEISRLTLSREFRRRKRAEARADVGHEAFGTPAHPTFPYVQLGLYLGAIALAKHLGISKLFLLTEPRLLVHFRRLGFPVRQVGAAIEHRGMRVLSTADVVNPDTQLPFFMRPLYRIIELEIAEGAGAATRKWSKTQLINHLTGQIGPGHAGARPSFRQRVLARVVAHRRPRHPDAT